MRLPPPSARTRRGPARCRAPSGAPLPTRCRRPPTLPPVPAASRGRLGGVVCGAVPLGLPPLLATDVAEQRAGARGRAGRAPRRPWAGWRACRTAGLAAGDVLRRPGTVLAPPLARLVGRVRWRRGAGDTPESLGSRSHSTAWAVAASCCPLTVRSSLPGRVRSSAHAPRRRRYVGREPRHSSSWSDPPRPEDHLLRRRLRADRLRRSQGDRHHQRRPGPLSLATRKRRCLVRGTRRFGIASIVAAI